MAPALGGLERNLERNAVVGDHEVDCAAMLERGLGDGERALPAAGLHRAARVPGPAPHEEDLDVLQGIAFEHPAYHRGPAGHRTAGEDRRELRRNLVGREGCDHERGIGHHGRRPLHVRGELVQECRLDRGLRHGLRLCMQHDRPGEAGERPARGLQKVHVTFAT